MDKEGRKEVFTEIRGFLKAMDEYVPPAFLRMLEKWVDASSEVKWDGSNLDDVKLLVETFMKTHDTARGSRWECRDVGGVLEIVRIDSENYINGLRCMEVRRTFRRYEVVGVDILKKMRDEGAALAETAYENYCEFMRRLSDRKIDFRKLFEEYGNEEDCES